MTFAQFFTILRARLGLIMAVIVTVVVIVACVTMALPKRYQAVTSVMVDQKVTYSNATTNQSNSRPGEVMSTQLDILTSPAVALRVVDQLNLAQRPDIGTLVQEYNPAKRAWWFVNSLFSSDDKGEQGDIRDWIAERLLDHLAVKSNRDSYVVRLTYTAPDPEFSSAVANGFAQAYLATVQSLRAGPAQLDTKEFDQQIKTQRQELEQAEEKLAKFQQQKGIVATDERLDLETSRLNEISGQLAMAQSMSYESQARQRQLQEFLASGGKNGAPADVYSSPVVQQLRQAVAEREARMSDMSKRIGPNHPQYVAAQNELHQLRSQLHQEMRSAAEGAMANSNVAPERAGALRAELERQRGKVLKLKSDRNQLAVLQRDVDAAKQAYDATAQRLTQSRMASEGGQATGTVVDAAVTPIKPAGPKLGLNIVLACIAGLVLGIGIALGCESVDGYVRSERDLLEILDVPILAVMSPKGSGRKGRYLAEQNIYALPRP
ncbi:MAG TPA: GNVR domain-containing protein [Burkholderiales bacterium]|nr:GNVR domain-containing protein [Burkholderiales bacterium]